MGVMMGRRNKKDRRSWGEARPFPFRDSDGQKVTSERRVLHGRRRNSIEGVWDELEQLYDFPGMLKSLDDQDD
jgi:hypothetical protein